MKFICLNYLLATAFFASMFLFGRPCPAPDRSAIGYERFIAESQKTPSYPKWARIHCQGFRPDIFVLHLREHGSFVENFSGRKEEISDSISLYIRKSIYYFYISEEIPVIESVKPKTIDKIKDYPSIAVEFPYKGDILTRFTNINETIDSIIIHTPEYAAFYKTICDLCDNYYKQNNSHISLERIGCPG